MKLLCSIYPGDGCDNLTRHFLSYYRKEGIKEFHLLLLKNPAAPNEEEVYDMLRKEPDVVCVQLKEAVATEQARVQLYTTYKQQQLSNCRMVFAVDADEFVSHPGDIYEAACTDDYDYVRGRLVDRFAHEGETAAVTMDKDLFRQFPVCSDFSWDALGALQSKTPLSKPAIEYRVGLHRIIDEERWTRPEWDIMVHHFKWTKGVIQRIRERVERMRSTDEFFSEKYQKECEWFLENHVIDDNRIDLEDIDTWYQPTP
ncbi:MAG: hypothetical protein VYC39_18760 [Myxococcota bacterium]|nr:hypothetical protein [Myxococcota bacterium]